MFQDRVLSGMRPTGQMHLGHYHGALKNWVKLQNEFPCLFFAADWHALTTHYEDPGVIEQTVWDMFIYRATVVPVGEDQVSHMDFAREVARRFNHLFGREKGLEQKAESAIKKM